MRICELNLLAFGPFTDTLIDLTAGEAGLQVIYGPNESGKSTSLRAIQSLLFGFPHTSKDGFIHDKPKVAGCLQSAGGTEISFVRRKGRKNTLLHPVTEAVIPESELHAFLGGVDRDTFQDIFAIDHVRLLKGGEELRQLRGLVGESLYTAALGGGRLVNVMAQLTEEAQEIFDTRKKCRIRIAEKEFKQALQDKKEATVPFSRWEKLQKELAQVLAARRQVAEKIQQLRIEEKRTERIRRSLRLLATRSQLLKSIDQIGTIELLPDSYSAEDRVQVENELAKANQRIDMLQARLEGERGLRRQQELLEVSTVLLENESVIRDLQVRLGAHLKADRDCESKLRPQLEQRHAQTQRLLVDLDADKSVKNIDQLRIGSNRMLGIRNLASEEKQVRAEPDRIAARRRELERTLARSQERLRALGKPRDLTRLTSACETLRKNGDFESEWRDLRESLATLEVAAKQKMSTLGLWHGSLTEASHLQVPLRETVERFDHDLTVLEQELARLAVKNRELTDELAEIQREIKALKAAESVPTEAELADLRQQRNRAWQSLRGALLGTTQPADRTQCEAYEALVAAADGTADRLRREAGRVQKLAQLHARGDDLEDRRQRLAADVRASQLRHAKSESDWRELWVNSGIQHPLSPREMLAWLNRFAEVQRCMDDLAEAIANRDNLELWMKEQSVLISDCLRQLDEKVNGPSLAILFGQAEKLIEIEVDRQRKRQQLREEIERLTNEVALSEQHELEASTILGAWQEQWTLAMHELGCPAEATAEQANQRVAKLDELFDQYDESRALEMRIIEIEKESAHFERSVAEIVARVDTSLTDETAVNAAGQLQQRLEAAQRADQEYARLAKEMVTIESELEAARQVQQSLHAALTRLCQLAGVGDAELLPSVEQSCSAYLECRQKLMDVDEQLQELGAGMPIEVMAREADEQDVDQLAARIAELTVEIESLESTRDELTSRQSELQSQCGSEDNPMSAAEADARALGILSRMHDDASRFLKLRLAAVMLRQQIERHRSENEDPILAKASDFFARMTCDEFRGLRTVYESDEAVIVGERRNGQSVDVEAMSTGTRDQLYLALRLAYLQRRLEQHEPLPFIVDDVLVHFDDERAGATLEVLTEVARQTQVILFTHHQRIADLAESRLPRETHFVHQLHPYSLSQ